MSVAPTETNSTNSAFAEWSVALQPQDQLGSEGSREPVVSKQSAAVAKDISDAIRKNPEFRSFILDHIRGLPISDQLTQLYSFIRRTPGIMPWVLLDGVGGSGKSSVAKELSQALEVPVFSNGSRFRAWAFAAKHFYSEETAELQRLAPENESSETAADKTEQTEASRAYEDYAQQFLGQLVQEVQIEFEGGQVVFTRSTPTRDREVHSIAESELRAPWISDIVVHISDKAVVTEQVRTMMLLEMLQHPEGGVVDGRDTYETVSLSALKKVQQAVKAQNRQESNILKIPSLARAYLYVDNVAIWERTVLRFVSDELQAAILRDLATENPHFTLIDFVEAAFRHLNPETQQEVCQRYLARVDRNEKELARPDLGKVLGPDEAKTLKENPYDLFFDTSEFSLEVVTLAVVLTALRFPQEAIYAQIEAVLAQSSNSL